jgi:primosomal protein DnaI
MIELKESLQSIDIKSDKNALLEGILSDGLILSRLRLLGLKDPDIEANLALVSAFQDSEHLCEHCPGLASCPQSFEGSKVDLLFEGGKLLSRYVSCPKNDALQNPIYRFLFHDFPEEWLDKKKFALAKSQRAVQVIKSFLLAREEQEHPWLYLVGESGSGKSFLAFNMAYSYAATGHSVAFISTPERFNMLKELSYKERANFDDLMVRLATIDLLVFDDFAKEYRSDFVRNTLLMPLLTLRDKAHLLTLFVSEKTPKDAALRYAYNASVRDEALGISSIIEKNLHEGKAVYIAKGFETYLSKR